MTEAEFAAELRAFARRLRQHSIRHVDGAPMAALARDMALRAAELTRSRPKRRTTLTTIMVGGRSVMVQKPRGSFGVDGGRARAGR